ncbi:MAG: DUF1648 domain-containing protein [Bacilli bacterium]
MSLSLIIFVIMLFLMPSMMPPTLPFGVRVPHARISDPTILKVRSNYRFMLSLATVLMVIASAVLGHTLIPTLTLGVSTALFIVLSYVCYYVAHRRLRRLKERENWYEDQQQAAVTVLEQPRWTGRALWPWIIPPLVVTATTILIGVWRYPSLPARMPNYYSMSNFYSANGAPHTWVARSVWSVFSPVLLQMAQIVVAIAMVLIMPRIRRELDPANPDGSAHQQRVFRRRMAFVYMIFALSLNTTVLLDSLFIWGLARRAGVGLIIGLWAFPTLAAMIVAVIFYRTGQLGARVSVSQPPAETGLTYRDDDRYWKGGWFYVNRDDSSFFVAQRFGFGWTINFGRPAAWIVVAAGVIPTVLLPLFLTVHG